MDSSGWDFDWLILAVVLDLTVRAGVNLISREMVIEGLRVQLVKNASRARSFLRRLEF